MTTGVFPHTAGKHAVTRCGSMLGTGAGVADGGRANALAGDWLAGTQICGGTVIFGAGAECTLIHGDGTGNAETDIILKAIYQATAGHV